MAPCSGTCSQKMAKKLPTDSMFTLSNTMADNRPAISRSCDERTTLVRRNLYENIQTILPVDGRCHHDSGIWPSSGAQNGQDRIGVPESWRRRPSGGSWLRSDVASR